MSRHLYSTARQLLFPGGAGRNVKKIRAPKFYLGLLEIMCWEPHGLQLFKVSVDTCYIYRSNMAAIVLQMSRLLSLVDNDKSQNSHRLALVFILWSS